MPNRPGLEKIARDHPMDAPTMDRHLMGNTGRVLSCASRCRVLTLILSCTVLGGAAPAGAPTHRALPMRAIVDGRNLQPRDDRLKALGFSDLTSKQAEEVDRLYRQLMQNDPAATKLPS